ncbi:carbonic anhydrase-like [Mugil cephalus]|uniref:carbonic anhydrase-like n=1 Tax=Mugil cephalus TaxID=48193 RepID=UPI001FB63901|nr:carbonic anhydrase-like [Mugil cephalus]
MYLRALVSCLSLGVLVKSAAGSEWCYHGCDYSLKKWDKIEGSYCGEKMQSPINIDTHNAVLDNDLVSFKFVNISSQQVIKSISNNGHTVICSLEENDVEVSGGGLDGTYSVVQFHFHMGDPAHELPGSEHTINNHRYPVEMHIVGMKKNVSEEDAANMADGFAVLGFFLHAMENQNMSKSWKMLASNLINLTDNTTVKIETNISIDELIGNVDLTKYYRYKGSLTTPMCNEAVMWTVFHEPIGISQELIDMFSLETGLFNNYRPTQDLNGRNVSASPAISHSWCYEGHCEPSMYEPLHWHLLPASKCGESNQSPINIDTDLVETDIHLGPFSFTNFDNKHAIKYITNTGHSVKCVLEEDMVELTGGGLEHVYSTLQFHFHWGSDEHDGSEHTMNSKHYPMEMHIVSKRKNLPLEEALNHQDGLAVLGFFIEAEDTTKSNTESSDHPATNPAASAASNMDAWKKLTSHLSAVGNISSMVNFTEEISIDDLLGNIDRTAYYRYSGSLTTPSCNEAVIWTIFKESVKVDPSLMHMFPAKAGYHDVFRPTQALNGRKIYSTSASSVPGPILLLMLLASLCALFMSAKRQRRATGASKASKMNCLVVAALALCVLAPSAYCATDSIAWCYNEPTCNDTTWPVIAAQFCNGTRQSPIDIVSATAAADANLTEFTFVNYSSTSALKKIENTGKTVKVGLSSGITVSGGDLSETYDSLQFHLHWGNGSAIPGSEHTVDGKRYPMELHIVNSKSKYNGNTSLAVQDSTGLAALGFFIEEMSGDATGQPASWKNLTSYLTSIRNAGESVTITLPISLDDLLVGVDRSKYYRYLGSLTTPTCNEAVVWTVFKDTIKVSKDLIDLFSTTLYVSNSTSPLMVNVYRNIQPAQRVTTQPATGSSSVTCYSLGLLALSLVFGRS